MKTIFSTSSAKEVQHLISIIRTAFDVTPSVQLAQNGKFYFLGMQVEMVQ